MNDQGNKPGMDASVYGLKFDIGKSRWDLFPFEVFDTLMSVDVKNCYIFTLPDKESHIREIINWIKSIRTSKSNNLIRLIHLALNIICILQKEYISKTIDEMARDLGCIIMKEIKFVVDIYTYGAKKYQDWNWIKVDPERYFAAFMRHFMTIFTDEKYDSESGFLHLHHALWNVFALIWFELKKEGQDDKKEKDIKI
jgi:hypothetical protein